MNKDKDIHYYLYKDEDLIKSIYSQIVEDIPELGIIEYFGGDTESFTKDYKTEALEENTQKEKCKRNLKTELRLCDLKGTTIIRESANIAEIKDMKKGSFYNNIINNIANHSMKDSCEELIYLNDYINTYDSYKNQPEIFLRMGEDCIWLKKELINVDIIAMSKLTGKLNLIGFVLRKKSSETPNIIRAIAIYI